VTGQALVRGGGRELEEKIGSLAGWPASLTSLGWVNREGLVLFLNLLGGLLALPVMPQLLALQTVVNLAVGARGTATCLGLWGRGALGLCAEQALVPPESGDGDLWRWLHFYRFPTRHVNHMPALAQDLVPRRLEFLK